MHQGTVRSALQLGVKKSAAAPGNDIYRTPGPEEDRILPGITGDAFADRVGALVVVIMPGEHHVHAVAIAKLGQSIPDRVDEVGVDPGCVERDVLVDNQPGHPTRPGIGEITLDKIKLNGNIRAEGNIVEHGKMCRPPIVGIIDAEARRVVIGDREEIPPLNIEMLQIEIVVTPAWEKAGF